MNGRDILLLGGGGFIGTALASALAKQGRNVHVVSRRPTSADFSQLQTHVGDLSDRTLLDRLLPRCGTVVHLASETTPGFSARAPTLEASNLRLTLLLLEALQEHSDIHLIYFSSGGTLYGDPEQLPVMEDAPLRPLSYYGAGKAAQEMFLGVFRGSGRPVTVLRPANAYGPGQSLHAGFGLVRTVLEQLLHDRPIEVWGDGCAVRDYLYIDDLVAACTLLIDRPTDNGIYNVGSGIGLSVGELIRRAGEVCGRCPRMTYRSARKSDVSRIVLDTSRIQALGWSPKVGIDAGLRLTWEWLLRKSE